VSPGDTPSWKPIAQGSGLSLWHGAKIFRKKIVKKTIKENIEEIRKTKFSIILLFNNMVYNYFLLISHFTMLSC
jgi:hypothetical protein